MSKWKWFIVIAIALGIGLTLFFVLSKSSTPAAIKGTSKLLDKTTYNPSVFKYRDKQVVLARGADYARGSLRGSAANLLNPTIRNRLHVQGDDSTFRTVSTYQFDEDARGFVYKDRPYAILTTKKDDSNGRYMVLYRFNETITNIEQRTPLIWPDAGPLQKNWIPFVHDDTLYCIAFTAPSRVILRVDVDTGKCETAYKTTHPGISDWIRGSTQCVTVMYNNEEYFMSTGHIKYRFSGFEHMFYLFESSPPFGIKYITDFFVFDRSHDRTWDIPHSSEYAAGMILDGENIIISYGVFDREGWQRTVKLADILPMFRPI